MNRAYWSMVGIIIFGCVSAATAQLLYFDDFNQFPNGTVLTDTNYVAGPWIPPGGSARISTNNGNTAGASAVASNLLGATRLFGEASAGAQIEYDAMLFSCDSLLTSAVTNQVVTINWLSWIAATKSLTATGGLAVGISATNTEDTCCNDSTCLTNLEPHTPLLFFVDSGAIYAFTNAVSSTAGHFHLVQIGNWSSYVGQIMTNVLTLDYPARRFSFSLNGTVLTNRMSLSPMCTNIFTEVDFYGVETFPTSSGNKFALDDIQIVATNAGTDASSFIVAAKGRLFSQTGAGTPSMVPTGWMFHCELIATTTGSVWGAKVQFPNGGETNLTQDTDPVISTDWEFNDQFTSQAALDAAYSSGLYSLGVLGANQGQQQSSLNLSGDTYPNTPEIDNYAAAQTIVASTNFILQWNSSGGGSSDQVKLEVDDASGNVVLSTPEPGSSNVLNGTTTSYLIPAGTLQAGTNYDGYLVFVKPVALDTNSIPGATGGAGYFEQTEFTLATLTPGASCVLAPALSTNVFGNAGTVTATVTTNSVPVAGVTVNFLVISGPDALNSGSQTTDGSGMAAFSYTGATNGTDIIQAWGAVNSLGFTGTATVVWLPAEVPPVAICQDVTVAAGAGCVANVDASQVDNGSYAQGEATIVSYVLSPPEPYSLGTNNVNLIVTDNRGGMGSCFATITVVDQTPPTITCSSNLVAVVPFGETSGVVTFVAPVVSDNCLVTSFGCEPPTGSSFPLGTNTVTCTAINVSTYTNTCSFQIVVTAAAPQADLAVSGSSDVATASLNNAFGYTLVVTNNGPQDAADAQLVDTLPSGALYSNATPSVGTCTNVSGVLTCDFGTLAYGAAATVSVVVTPTNPAVASACSSVSATNSVLDPVPANNSATVCTPVVINNMAVTAFTAPKKETLSTHKTNVVGKLSVTIQNRGQQEVVIPDLTVLGNLVTVELTALGPDTNSCPTPIAQLVPPKPTSFPITLAFGKSLKVAYTVDFTCDTEPAGLKTNTYQYAVTVHHAAIDGVPDSYTADDVCPHNALGVVPYTNGKIKDTGCGLKNKDGSFGPVVTELIDTRAQ